MVVCAKMCETAPLSHLKRQPYTKDNASAKLICTWGAAAPMRVSSTQISKEADGRGSLNAQADVA